MLRIENALVVTRARPKQQLEEEEAAQRQRELSSGVQLTTFDQIAGNPEQEDLSTGEENEVDEEVCIPMKLRHLDEELFEGERERSPSTAGIGFFRRDGLLYR